MTEELIFTDEDEFWTYLQNAILTDRALDQSRCNRAFVAFLKAASDHIQIYVNDDQDMYRCALYLINSELYEQNKIFCISKLLSMLNMERLETNFKYFISYVLLLDCKNDSSLLQSILDYQGFWVVYKNIYHNFQTLQVLSQHEDAEVGTICVLKKMTTVQLDLLFQICKYLSIPVEDLRRIDHFFVNYIFESLIVAYSEEDVFNAAKFKFILAVNEQFMVAARDGQIENKVFTAIANHRSDSSKNFNQCLLMYFNRENDRCLQIMISKILYLIFTSNSTSDLFYHNDLNVLVEVIIRELTDLSEDEENIRNTFLRVLYPVLKNPHFQHTQHKRNELIHLLKYLAGQSDFKFWNQTDTTKRLALKCLDLGWLQDKKESQAGPEQELEKPIPLAHVPSNDSETSLNSLSKRPPPPPPPPRSLPKRLIHRRNKSPPPIPGPRIR